MLIRQAFRFRLRQQPLQARGYARTAGCCRFVWNKALALQQRYYRLVGKHLGYTRLANRLPRWKRQHAFLSEAPFEDPPVDHSRRLAKLAEMAQDEGEPVRGVQVGRTSFEARISIHPRTDCQGHDVQLAYVDTAMRVARELPVGTCGYNRMLEHEKTHVRIYRDMARQFAELTLPPGRGPETVLEYARQQYEVLYKQQTDFDSPAEYAKNMTACDGEILSMLRMRSRS